MSNNNQIPTALEFLHRDESGVYNEVDITQAMDGYAKLHVEQIKQFLHNEICERRDYSASKMCEEVLKFIDGGEITIGRNNNPDNTLNMTALRTYITMYLDDIDAYGEENELTEATNVLYDFVMYLKSMRGLTEGETDERDYEQYMDEYNAMEEESETNDIISMGDQPE